MPLARYMLLQFSLTGRNAQFELISKFLYKPSPLTVQLHNVEISCATQVFYLYTLSQSYTKCTDLQLPSFWWSEFLEISLLFQRPAMGGVGGVNNQQVQQQNTYGRPSVAPPYQPAPVYSNRGPIAKNEAPSRIVPIAALNPY